MLKNPLQVAKGLCKILQNLQSYCLDSVESKSLYDSVRGLPRRLAQGSAIRLDEMIRSST